MPHEQQAAGYLNGKEAARHRGRVAPEGAPRTQVTPEVRCIIDTLCQCLTVSLLSIQQAARRPSHIDVPFSGVCFKRHIGTGSSTSPDPPVVLPPVGPGGPFTLLADLITPQQHRGIVNKIGIDINPTNTVGDIEIVATVGGPGLALTTAGQPTGSRDAVFGTEFGPVMPAVNGSWFGFPYGIGSPGDFCIHLARQNVFRLYARNTLLIGAPVEIAAIAEGWVYPVQADASDNSINGTLTDNPLPRGYSA
jgi:hypothetical protein